MRVPTENDVRAAMAEGKKIVVLSEVDGFELCVPEDGFRPRDSFWRRKKEMMEPLSALAAVVRMSGLERAAVRESESKVTEQSAETAKELAVEPLSPVKLRLIPRPNKYEVPDTIERDEKICIDCEFPYPLGAFYTNTATKDGRQSRCKECDKKRRTEYNQGLHVKTDAQDEYIREASRKRACEMNGGMGKAAPYVYKGVSGGFLIYGYVR
jgi:hypothetical protein